MKIEHKKAAWNCGHKSTQRGQIARMWRKVHKQARTVWKESMHNREYDNLVKRI